MEAWKTDFEPRKARPGEGSSVEPLLSAAKPSGGMAYALSHLAVQVSDSDHSETDFEKE